MHETAQLCGSNHGSRSTLACRQAPWHRQPLRCRLFGAPIHRRDARRTACGPATRPMAATLLGWLGHRSPKGLERRFHSAKKHSENPLLRADKVWEGTSAIIGPYCYGTAFRENGTFRLWYQVLYQGNHVGYAESEDGIHWRKPELPIISYQGNQTNLVVSAFDAAKTEGAIATIQASWLDQEKATRPDDSLFMDTTTTTSIHGSPFHPTAFTGPIIKSEKAKACSPPRMWSTSSSIPTNKNTLLPGKAETGEAARSALRHRKTASHGSNPTMVPCSPPTISIRALPKSMACRSFPIKGSISESLGSTEPSISDTANTPSTNYTKLKKTPLARCFRSLRGAGT